MTIFVLGGVPRHDGLLSPLLIRRKRSDVNVTRSPSDGVYRGSRFRNRVVVEAALLAVLFVADLLHPVNRLAVETLLNGDVCHGGGGCCPMPMFLPWWDPGHVPRTNVFNRASPALCQTTASHHNQSLAQRVCVPGGSSTWLERDTGP